MSLIAWFPFNGDTNNQGTSSGSYSSTSVGYTSGGKVTNSFRSSGNLTLSASLFNEITSGKNFSVAFWFNNRSQGSQHIMGTNGNGWGSNPRRLDFFAYPSQNDFHWSCGNWGGSVIYNVLPDNTWVHICMVCTSTTYNVYINGISKASGGLVNQEYNYDYQIGMNMGYGLNDVRFYDHALSLKEIEQLSKGLCLHYSFNFDDLYTPVEYIQSSGIQYIDTGYKYSTADDLEIVLTPNDEGIHFGGGLYTTSEGELYLGYRRWLAHKNGSAVMSNDGYLWESSELGTQKTITYNGTSKKVFVNNVEKTTITQDYSTNINMYLFCLNRNGSLYDKSNVKLYSFKAKRNGVLVRDYIPAVRNIDGKPGLFDRVNNVFYTNAGNGEFIYPSDFSASNLNTSNASISGNTISVTKSASQWGDGGVTSKQAYNAAYLHATIGQNNQYAMIGFAPINTSFNFTQGYFIYPQADATYHIYELGTHIGSFGTYSSGDTFDVIYDGSTITYYYNGSYVRSISVNGNMYINITTHNAATTVIKDVTYGRLERNTIDNSGYGNTGTALGTSLPSSDTVIGNQSSIQSNSCYYNNNFRCFNNGDSVSAAVWFKQTSRSGYQCLCGTRTQSDNLGFYIYTHTTDGSIQLHGTDQFKSTNIPTLNEWHHVVATVEGTTAKVYLDGSLVQTISNYNYHTQNLHRINVGGYLANGAASATECFKGNIADVKVFATTLSADDVQQLYKNRAVIDNQGNIYCDCLETKSNGNVNLPTSTGVIKCGDIDDGVDIAQISGYARLEYIESTGNQYIDTGYSNSEGFAAEINFMLSSISSTSYGYMIGCHNLSDPYGRNGFQPYYSKWQLGHGDYCPTAGTPLANTLYYGEVNTKKGAAYLKINGDLILTDNTSTTLSSFNVLMFTDQYMWNYYGTTSPAKVYSCKIYTPDKSQLVRDYIPVKRNSDNAIGLLDKVNNVFYPSATSTAFIAGPEYSRIIQCNNFYLSDGYNGRPYLESDYIELDYIQFSGNGESGGSGTQIDTGIYFNIASGKAEICYQATTTSQNGMLLANDNRSGYYFWLYYYGLSSGKVDVYTDVRPGISGRTVDLNKHTAVYQNTTLYIDGTSYGSLPSGQHGNCASTLYIGSLGKSAGYYFTGKIYYCKLYDQNSTLARYFIPALRKIDGKPGMYDKVTKSFYTNSGSGEFITGPITSKNYLI